MYLSDVFRFRILLSLDIVQFSQFSYLAIFFHPAEHRKGEQQKQSKDEMRKFHILKTSTTKNLLLSKHPVIKVYAFCAQLSIDRCERRINKFKIYSETQTLDAHELYYVQGSKMEVILIKFKFTLHIIMEISETLLFVKRRNSRK